MSAESIDILIYVALLWCGLLSRYFQAIFQIKKGTGVTMSPCQYYLANRAHTLFLIISAVAAFIIFWRMGQMNETTAFTIGYMCDSIADTIGQRSNIARPAEGKSNAA